MGVKLGISVTSFECHSLPFCFCFLGKNMLLGEEVGWFFQLRFGLHLFWWEIAIEKKNRKKSEGLESPHRDVECRA
jgi:hypothetical protein